MEFQFKTTSKLTHRSTNMKYYDHNLDKYATFGGIKFER